MQGPRQVVVTLHELRWFLMVAQTENISQAALRLNLSQPALSRAIHRVERAYGVDLFDREKQRLRLNRYGEALRKRLDAVMIELAAAEDDIAMMSRSEPGVVSLAFLHSFGTWLVPDLLGRFGAVDAHSRFLLHQDSADQVSARLADGRADLVLTSPRPPDPLVSWSPLRDEPLELVVPLSHPLAARRALAVADIIDEALIMMQPEFGLRQTIDAMFARRGVRARIALESAEIATIKALVASGLGVAIAPSGPHVPAAPGVVSIPLTDEDAYRTIGLAWRMDRRLSAPARRFRSFVRSVAAVG